MGEGMGEDKNRKKSAKGRIIHKSMIICQFRFPKTKSKKVVAKITKACPHE